jgi:hypothetical protein
MCHGYLPILRVIAAFLARALRWTLYAMATACLTGFPDLISAATLRLKQFCEAHLRIGIFLIILLEMKFQVVLLVLL